MRSMAKGLGQLLNIKRKPHFFRRKVFLTKPDVARHLTPDRVIHHKRHTERHGCNSENEVKYPRENSGARLLR